MQFGEIDIPDDLGYTKKHLWIRRRNGLCTLGWTDYIQGNAGDVTYVELPEAGAVVEAGRDFGSIETSKWVDKLYSPVAGRVVEVNEKTATNPELINESPFADGWLIRIEPRDDAWLKELMSPAEYRAYIESCEE